MYRHCMVVMREVECVYFVTGHCQRFFSHVGRLPKWTQRAAGEI